jgi:DNA processing protein
VIRATEPNVAGYPTALLGLVRPPARLWLRGPGPDERAVAVVGTRRPDGSGRRLAGQIAAELVAAGYAVISGLALGVDAAAQRAAVAAGGRTWAVVGCGVDRADCPEDPTLVEDLLAAGGGIVAEVPEGTPASAPTLVARDRIQSGLSLATVVVQTDLASGTMHTARFCLQQGRPLAVVAPPAGLEGRARVWGGNRALGAARGADPAVLHAKGKLARELAAKRPLADLIVPVTGGEADLTPLMTTLRRLGPSKSG